MKEGYVTMIFFFSGAEKTEQKAEQKKWEKGFIGIFKNGEFIFFIIFILNLYNSSETWCWMVSCWSAN